MNITCHGPVTDGPESNMLSILLKQIKFLPLGIQSDQIWIARELAIGAGRSDIIICNQFIDQDFSVLTSDQVKIVAYLRSVLSAKLSTIEKRTSISLNKIIQSLEYLCEKNIVKSSEKGAYSVSKEYRIGLQKAIAIEGKIGDWKGALRQALRNQLFAKQSFIAMPLKQAIRVSRRNELLCTSVGIIGVDVMTGSCVVIKNAQENHPIAWFYHYLLMKENTTNNRRVN